MLHVIQVGYLSIRQLKNAATRRESSKALRTENRVPEKIEKGSRRGQAETEGVQGLAGGGRGEI